MLLQRQGALPKFLHIADVGPSEAMCGDCVMDEDTKTNLSWTVTLGVRLDRAISVASHCWWSSRLQRWREDDILYLHGIVKRVVVCLVFFIHGAVRKVNVVRNSYVTVEVLLLTGKSFHAFP